MVPTPVAAAGPGSAETATGIAPDTGGDPGYTSQYAREKQALFDSWVASRNLALNPFYTSNSLTNWTSYHQKQSWYCLPAVGQSILKYNFGSAYISPSVGTKQASIARRWAQPRKALATLLRSAT